MFPGGFYQEITPTRGLYEYDLEEELDFSTLYPSIFHTIGKQITPQNLVTNIGIPNERCIIVKWTDREGEHIYRFAKDEHAIQKAYEVVKELRDKTGKTDEENIEALTPKPPDMDSMITSFDKELDPDVETKMNDMKSIFEKNFSHPEIFHGLLSTLHSGKLCRDTKYDIIIVTGPFCSGKSLVIDVIEAFVGKEKCFCLPDNYLGGKKFLSDLSFFGTRELPHYSVNIMKNAYGKELLIFKELLPKPEQYKIFWDNIVKASEIIPILIGVSDEEMEMIPPKDREKCIILRCERELSRDERDTSLRDRHKIKWIAETYRSIFDKN